MNKKLIDQRLKNAVKTLALNGLLVELGDVGTHKISTSFKGRDIDFFANTNRWHVYEQGSHVLSGMGVGKLISFLKNIK